jgi:glycosyltransferase involved in cell wall biosynthesis
MYPNCIDPKMFDPGNYSAEEIRALRAELGFTEQDIVATFIGTFGQWHGVDVLATAIRELVEHDRQFLDAHRVRFLLVGDGQKMPLVRETLAAADCARYARLTGLVPQHLAPKYLAASDILLSPHVANADGSAFFGSPTKLFEYMAMGKAIYASDLDQIGDVLRHSLRVDALPTAPPSADESRIALLGRPGNTADLCNGLRFLAANPQWRLALGTRVRQEALEKYTWRRHVSAILERFEALRRTSAEKRS